jgi:hypothetical protein
MRAPLECFFECHLIYYFSSPPEQQQFIKADSVLGFVSRRRRRLFCSLSSQHVIKNNHVWLAVWQGS